MQKLLVFSRNDLINLAKNFKIEYIDLHCFKTSLEEISFASTVFFIDTDGTNKVLKQRNAI